MQIVSTLLNRFIRVVVCWAVMNAVCAEEANLQPEEDGELGAVVVTGKRASLATAQQIKQDSLGIVDSVVAEDVHKLPDFNVTDALQRVSGVQITRDRGEGANVAIRGLTQMETLLNGREVFTAGTGRSLDFADMPSELISQLNVYKTSSAELIEGGVGGTVDVRTRRPFDFNGLQVVGSARGIYGDLVDQQKPQFSGLLSNRWQSESWGEFGALLNVAYQQRAWREDQFSLGNPCLTYANDQQVILPSGITETTSVGQRQRASGNAVLQWQPSDRLEFYAEGNYTEFKTLQDSYQFNAQTRSGLIAGSSRLFSGTQDLSVGQWANAPLSILSFARDTVDRTRQLAIGGSWRGKQLTIKSDFSHTVAYNNLFFSGLTLKSSAANLGLDLSGSNPELSIGGTNLLDPANFQFSSLAYRTRPFRGILDAAQIDVDYQLAGRLIDSVSAGFRYASRGANNAPGLIYADAAVGYTRAGSDPNLIHANAYSDFLSGAAGSISDFIVADLGGARDATALRRRFGVSSVIPASASLLTLWHISEATESAYISAKLKSSDLPLSGNLGVRLVQTQESVSGGQPLAANNSTPIPINVDSTYGDVLPSINLRYELQPGVFLRAAAAKTMTRVDFNHLSPSLSLVRNTITPSMNSGLAGNPALKPVRADNFDIAVERYFNRSTSVYVTGFFKKVDGFLVTVSRPETYDGVVYQVARPQNLNTADIQGFEVGYQQFYDFLPQWLNGIGMQANYTFVDSQTPNRSLGGRQTPLQNLSKHSYNLIALYEKDAVSMRLAYNWRDDFLSGISNVVGVGAVPVFSKAYGWLDAAVSYRFNKAVTLGLEGTNLLATVRRSNYAVDSRPNSIWLNDTQVSATLTLRY